MVPIIIIVFISAWGCTHETSNDSNHLSQSDEIKIRGIHQDYVDGWKDMNEEKIMGLLQENSRIQPNRMAPIEGKEHIRKFWFPNDSSETIIHEYTTEIMSLDLVDTIAVTTHTSLLDWSYKKGTTSFGMVQKGINTTVYKKQSDSSWKIWRSMWTDIDAKRK